MVLVVDDEENIRFLVESALRLTGIRSAADKAFTLTGSVLRSTPSTRCALT